MPFVLLREAEVVWRLCGRIEEHSWGRSLMEGFCYADDGWYSLLGGGALEEKVERFVRSVEA